MLPEYEITEQPLAAHPLEFEVSRGRMSQFVRRSLLAQVCLWNDLPYTVLDTGAFDMVFMGIVNRWLLRIVFLSVFRGVFACELTNAIHRQFCFSLFGLRHLFK